MASENAIKVNLETTEEGKERKQSTAQQRKSSGIKRASLDASLMKNKSQHSGSDAGKQQREPSNVSVDILLQVATSSEKMKSPSILDAIRPPSTGDLGGERAPKQVIRYMNSYRLDSKNPFRKEMVYNIIREVMNEQLEPQSYDPVVMMRNSTNLAAEIRSRVKALEFERYKLVCIVQICEKNKQSIITQTKFLWDSERDNCAVYTLDTMQFLACGAVYGLYFE